MRPTAKPPLGVMSLYVWRGLNPEPTVGELLDRYAAVAGAVARYRAAKRLVPVAWLEEILADEWPGQN